MCGRDGCCSAGWAEPLPTSCPPADAVDPAGKQYFRFVNAYPPTDDDFKSHRALFPQRTFNQPECQVRAVSLFESPEACDRAADTFPHFRSMARARLTLLSGAGVISLPNRRTGHSNWWPCTDFRKLVVVDDGSRESSAS